MAEVLPQVLVIRPSPVFLAFEEEFSKRFEILKAYESSLSTELFLQTLNATSSVTVKALLCSPICPVTADVLRLLPSLGLVVTSSTGVDHIDLHECRHRGIAVANVRNVFSVDVADLAVGLMIDVLRRISAGDRFVRSGRWPSLANFPLGSKLGGRRVGIVGLGCIGSLVAKRLEAFGCAISYNSRKKKPSISYPFYPNVHELSSNCDVLIICCELNDQTHHMINKEVLSALGKDGVIVNVARGAIVHEKEMVQCLLQGDIAGAGLDVFEKEPNVPAELFALENVVILPHKAANTDGAFSEACQLVMSNLEAFFSNKPLLTPVTDDELFKLS